MKNILKYTMQLSLAVMIAFSSTSCDSWLDVNEDPHNPQQVDPSLILPPLLYRFSKAESFDFRYTGCYTRHWGHRSSDFIYERFGSSTVSGTHTWTTNYYEFGNNITEMIEGGQELNQSIYEGIGKAIRAWGWLVTTVRWGQIPFDQAFEPGQFSFDYDTQKHVYEEIRRICNESLAALDRAKSEDIDPKAVDADLSYGADPQKWEMFVYSILARIEIHLSRKSSFNPQAAIDFANQSFKSNDDNFAINFTGETNDSRFFWGPTRQNLNVYRPTTFFVDILDGTIFNGVQDPRISYIMKPSLDGVYRGVEGAQGDPFRGIDANKEIPLLYENKWNESDITPHHILTYWEMQFIKAEAYYALGDNANALSSMKEGITAHMQWLTVPDADIQAFLSSAALPTAATLDISHIMTQKHITMFLSNESWTDLRRHRYDPNVYLGYDITPPNGQRPNSLYEENEGHLPYRWLPRQYSELDWNVAALEVIGGLDPRFHTFVPWIFVDNEEDQIESFPPLPIIGF